MPLVGIAYFENFINYSTRSTSTQATPLAELTMLTGLTITLRACSMTLLLTCNALAA
jgi:hypothetical protein